MRGCYPQHSVKFVRIIFAQKCVALDIEMALFFDSPQNIYFAQFCKFLLGLVITIELTVRFLTICVNNLLINPALHVRKNVATKF